MDVNYWIRYVKVVEGLHYRFGTDLSHLINEDGVLELYTEKLPLQLQAVISLEQIPPH
jgi:hypothetical protein